MNSHTVYFTAQLRRGFKRSGAIRSLGDTFTLDMEQVKRLLQSAPKAVKRDVKKAQANQIIKALWQGGWHSELHCDGRLIYSTIDEKPNTMAIDAEAITPSTAPLPSTQLQSGLAEVASGLSEPVSKTVTVPLKTERLLRLAAPDQSCSVCIPERWEAMQQLNPNACLQAGCSQTDSYLVVIPQVKLAMNRPVSQQEYAEAVLESAIGWVEGGAIVAAATPQKQLQFPAVTGEFEGVVGDHRVHYLISVYEGQSSFYACYLWSAADSFEQQRPLLQALLASFRIQ